jgi:hypothetical protein
LFRGFIGILCRLHFLEDFNEGAIGNFLGLSTSSSSMSPRWMGSEECRIQPRSCRRGTVFTSEGPNDFRIVVADIIRPSPHNWTRLVVPFLRRIR